MVIRLGNVSGWALLPPDSVFPLYAEEGRKVRFDLNCETDTRLEVHHGEDITFLATINGMETVEFTTHGVSHLVAQSDGEVWYRTDEGERIDFETHPDTVSFTEIANRRVRNPQMEMMMFKAEQNINRRIAALDAEMEARIEAMGVRADARTGEVIEDGENDQGATSRTGGEPEPVPPVPPVVPPAGPPASASAPAGVPGGSTPAK